MIIWSNCINMPLSTIHLWRAGDCITGGIPATLHSSDMQVEEYRQTLSMLT